MAAALFGLVIASLISGVFLRAAVALANKVFVPDPADFREAFSPSRKQETEPNFGSLVDLEPDNVPANSNPFAGSNTPTSTKSSTNNNPYAAPTHYGSPQTKASLPAKLAIPEPTYGHACGISFVQGLVVTVMNFALVSVAPIQLAPFASIGLTFVAATFVYGLMLPTSAARAFVIYLFQILIMIAVAIVLAVVIFGVMAIVS